MRLRGSVFGGAITLIAAMLICALFESDGFGLLLVLLFAPGFVAVGYWIAENLQFSFDQADGADDDDDWWRGFGRFGRFDRYRNHWDDDDDHHHHHHHN